MKPKKKSIFQYYIWPFIDLPLRFIVAASEIFGCWYCKGCKRHHGPRTIQYGRIIAPMKIQIGYCSLHTHDDNPDAAAAWREM